jgi:DNA modification methylase
VHLVVTSPPYWTLKEYPRVKGQLGRVEDYETFLRELDRVWTECERVLVPGGRICCVVGNVRVPRRKLGRHLVAPLPADVGNVVTYAINFGALIQRHMQTRRRHPTPGVEFNVNKRREKHRLFCYFERADCPGPCDSRNCLNSSKSACRSPVDNVFCPDHLVFSTNRSKDNLNSADD